MLSSADLSEPPSLRSSTDTVILLAEIGMIHERSSLSMVCHMHLL